MVRKIGINDIENLSVGAAILGTGGGGDPYIGKLMAIDAIKNHGEVDLISPEEVPDSACVIPTGMMGAPTILIEKVPNYASTSNFRKIHKQESLCYYALRIRRIKFYYSF